MNQAHNPTVFFHVDLDAFFASVEQFDNPLYRGKPVVVGGCGKQGVVSTCSYEARQYGIRSAMPMRQAKNLCPHAFFIEPRIKRYLEKSKQIMSIIDDFTPEMQQISIDEAFLNMSGMKHIWESPYESAKQLKKIIHQKTGLTISIGVASNKYVAKIASSKSKPDGLRIINSGSETAFMQSLALSDIWGIGIKNRTKLNEAGLVSIADVLLQKESILQLILGKHAGSFLYHAVRGKCYDVFNEKHKKRSISTERTFAYDIYAEEDITNILFQFSTELMYRIIEEQITGSTVHIKIRYTDFMTVTAQQTGIAINDTIDLYNRLKALFFKHYNKNLSVRLIGAGIGIDTASKKMQQELFISEKDIKKRKIEETTNHIAHKNKAIKVGYARLFYGTVSN